jgi:signal transduction histidine kinase
LDRPRSWTSQILAAEGGRAIRLLVVDDDAADRLAVRRSFAKTGIDVAVDEVASADEALERLRRDGVDCVFLDYHLPGTDGMATLRALRESGVDVPVVILTGRGDEQTAVELMKGGAADYLPKAGLTPERLAASLRHALEVSRLALARRQAEEALRTALAQERAARDEAEHATRARDAVLGIVAHDLRNPLNAIAMSAAILEEGVPEDRRARQVGIIRRSAKAMEHLIRDLLDVTTIEAGTFAVRREPLEIAALLEEAREQLEVLARSRDIALTCSVGRGLPAVAGDRHRLAQVLSNLLGNALKFTPSRGRVRLLARREGADVEIAVEDTGPGIPPEHLARVFDRFWQAERASGKGAGLGLAIAKGIVEAHGGTIRIESGRAGGTTVRFTLPASSA